MQQIHQTMAAAMAANIQWFPAPDGSDCTTAAATATISSGWPGSQGSPPAASTGNICMRRRILLRGGRWSSWRNLPGSTVQTWKPNWAGAAGGATGGVSNTEFDFPAVVEDAIANAEDVMDGLVYR